MEHETVIVLYLPMLEQVLIDMKSRKSRSYRAKRQTISERLTDKPNDNGLRRGSLSRRRDRLCLIHFGLAP